MAFKTIAAAAMCCAAANGASDMEVLVRDTMHTATAGGDVPRLDEVQAAIAPTFQAMPKNQLGRLESEHVRHVLHRYFTSQRGWTIAGLDDVTPEGEQPLAARAQRTAEEARRSRGLALSDVAAVALAVEGAVGGELQELLQASFEHNQIAVDATLDASSLETVLTSFLGFLTRGMQSIEEAVSSNLEVEALASMPRNAVKGASASVSFDGAMAAAHRMMESFSHWQGWRCAMTKATLQGLGAAPAVSDLYRYGLATEGLPFTQSPEYLREIGALDDTDGTPRVRIPNYMQGPSNCLSATPDLAFCCPSACDAAVARIHGAVQGPVASAEQLREVVPGIQVEADSDVELHGPAFAALMRGAMPEERSWSRVGLAAASSPPRLRWRTTC